MTHTADARAVSSMFSRIARRYDLANDVLSFGTHRWWRARAVAAAAVTAHSRVLDCACGTGDLSFAFERRGAAVVGTDFNEDMLALARQKGGARGSTVYFKQADVMALPFGDASFDVASIAFGIRNVADPRRGLRELLRVVRPGGRVVVLELGQPRGAFGMFFRAYARRVMPIIGAALTRDLVAYRYLQTSAAAFPAGQAFVELLPAADMAEVAVTPLLFGVAYLYVATKRATIGGHVGSTEHGHHRPLPLVAARDSE